MTNEQLQELASIVACNRHTWAEIGQHFGLSWQAVRGQWRRHGKGVAVNQTCAICSAGAAQSTTSWKVQGNYATGSVQAADPLGLDGFLDLLGVDTDAWVVQDWEASTWQQNVTRRGELEFTDGVLDGHLEYSPEIVDLWAHKARFIRRQPVALQPVVAPVACPVIHELGTGLGGRTERSLLISDLHIGYYRDNQTGRLVPMHDRQAIDAVLRVAEGYRSVLDAVYILGDLLDLTNWNDKFARRPEFYWTTQPAILEAHWLLRRLRTILPHARLVWMMGNHEDRMRKALERHLLEAYALRAADEMHLPPALSPQKLLALDALGIEYEPDYPGGERWLGPLRVSHGDVARQPPGASARAMIEKTVCDNAFGHTHKLEMVSKMVRDRGGSVQLRSLSTGCLCHTDGRVPPHGSPENWQQGFVLVDHTDYAWTPTLVGLNNGHCLLGSREIWGKDYTEVLRMDLPDWNW